jgi:hypothetical protein
VSVNVTLHKDNNFSVFVKKWILLDELIS